MSHPADPTDWSLEQLREHLDNQLSFVASTRPDMPLVRLRFQLSQDSAAAEVLERWAALDAQARTEGWKALLDACQHSSEERLPVCVRCGLCCEQGSPTLVEDDLELLGDNAIRWDQLLTLREGEPAYSPYTDKPFFLLHERIKVRERNGRGPCVYYAADGEEPSCTIYVDRPMQCRAQACWDTSMAEQQAKEPPLTRRHVFASIEPLLQLIAEHEARCGFGDLRDAFDQLAAGDAAAADQVLAMLAFDEHVREFARDQVGVPSAALELLFGRSLTERLPLFGFEVEVGPDGTRTVVPRK